MSILLSNTGYHIHNDLDDPPIDEPIEEKQMKIVLLGTPEVENKGKYNQLLVKYQSDGKDSERKIMSFTFKEVYETLKTAQVGDAFDVKLEKEGKYWNWVEVKPLGREAVEASSSSKKPVGTWETAEERAFKQICIVRQSSIANAIAFYTGCKDPGDSMPVQEGDIIELAQRFEAYVFSKSEVVNEPAEVE